VLLAITKIKRRLETLIKESKLKKFKATCSVRARFASKKDFIVPISSQ